MRNRTTQLNIRLSEHEMDRLKRNAARCGLSTSAYVRMLVNGYAPKEMPPVEYGELMSAIYAVHAAIEETGGADDAAAIRRLTAALQGAVTAPEMRGGGC
ncbi:MAG: hypothetical protein LBR00_05185 [Clostridiales Family XIII bacterium]|jgi:antitoxin component of RelBE/YafQ-DinJ toxin-antitoxin module|nr:hypothetical protein [Clostridiales Family XIII bacterium]